MDPNAPFGSLVTELERSRFDRLWGKSCLTQALCYLWLLFVFCLFASLAQGGFYLRFFLSDKPRWISLSKGSVLGDDPAVQIFAFALVALAMGSAIGCLRHARWGRVCGLIFSIIVIFGGMIGLLLGLLGLWALWSGELFRPNGYRHRELKAEYIRRREEDRRLG